MKIEYIREYLVLMETLNYSVAAKQLFISQSTLSRHIHAMEEELGQPLFITSSHSVVATEFAKTVTAKFRKIAKDYKAVLEESRRFASRVEGTLVLGLLYYAIDDHFSDFLVYFREKYPDVRLVCRSELPQSIHEGILSGRMEIGTLFYSENRPPEELRCRTVAKFPMIAVMREDNPLCVKSAVTLGELAAYPLVELKYDGYSNEQTETFLRANKVDFSQVLQADDIETMPMVVRATGGIHITGESCRKQNAAGLVYKPITGAVAASVLGFCSLESYESPLVELFYTELQHFFK